MFLNASRQALWKGIRQGKIQAVRPPLGRYRIPEREVVRILQSSRGDEGMRIPLIQLEPADLKGLLVRARTQES